MTLFHWCSVIPQLQVLTQCVLIIATLTRICSEWKQCNGRRTSFTSDDNTRYRCHRLVRLPLVTVPFRCLCSACMEQSATRDSDLLLTFDIPEGDQVSPFSSVIRLTWRRLLRWSANVCIELCNSFRSGFCKVSRNCVIAAL